MYHQRIANIVSQLGENDIKKYVKIERINVGELKDLLDSPEQKEYRDAARKFLQSDPSFVTNFETLSPPEYKEVVLKQLKAVAENQVMQFTDIKSNIHRFCSTIGILSMYNNNICTKLGVHYSLFGGTITLLGTERHHKYIEPANKLKIAGCFAMTEIGHGSNVRGLETTATYDQATQEFVINSPTPTSQKFWIGGAALHAHYTTVFARLIVKGKDHGIHAIVVPMRDPVTNKVLPGITVKDCGQKLGLNGIDNGQIKFDHVRVPRENLLNKYSDVAADGTYTSAMPTPIKNFAATMAPFIGGRLVITMIASGATKTSLAIAIKFSHLRKQFGPEGQAEQPIISISSQRQRLIVPLARLTILDLFLHKIACELATENAPPTIHPHCSGIKAVYTWEALKCLQVCREACGGQGFRAANRIAEFKSDCDVIVTYEGDNTVLMQQVAKFLLAAKRKPVNVTTVIRREADLFDFEKVLSLFRLRTEMKLETLHQLMDSSAVKDKYNAFNQYIPWAQATAQAYMDTVILDNALKYLKKKTVQPLPAFIYLYCLTTIQDDLAWFLSNQLISIEISRSIPFIILDICNEITPHLLDIVESFAIPKKALPAEDLISDLF